MRNTRRLWLILLSFIATANLWYLYLAISSLSGYFSLNTPIAAQQIEWSVETLYSDYYVPKAVYTYEIDGQKYQGKFLLFKDRYWNADAIKKDLKLYQSRRWIVWYSSKDPHHSSLQKIFPLKECLSAAALSAILIYFIGMALYVLRNGRIGSSQNRR